MSKSLTFSISLLLGLCCGQELTGVARWWIATLVWLCLRPQNTNGGGGIS